MKCHYTNLSALSGFAAIQKTLFVISSKRGARAPTPEEVATAGVLKGTLNGITNTIATLLGEPAGAHHVRGNDDGMPPETRELAFWHIYFQTLNEVLEADDAFSTVDTGLYGPNLRVILRNIDGALKAFPLGVLSATGISGFPTNRNLGARHVGAPTETPSEVKP